MSEAEDLRARLRATAQILIDEIGADGPADAEEVAREAVGLLRNIKVDLSNARQNENTLLRIAAAVDCWERGIGPGSSEEDLAKRALNTIAQALGARWRR